MPIYEVEFSPPGALISRGPCIPIEISLPDALVDQLNQQGQPVPSNIEGDALVDTGASCSAIDHSVCQQLNLQPIGITTIGHAGGEMQTNQYPVRFIFPNLTVEFGPVIEVELAPYNIKAIIGRDLLSQFMLIYNGPANRFLLTI